MQAPYSYDHRLDATTQRLLRAFADAEETNADFTDLAHDLIKALSSLSPLGVEALERTYRSARFHASYRSPAEPVVSVKGLSAYLSILFKPRLRPRPALRHASTPELQWIRILDRSGFVRESILREIDEPPTLPIFLAALLHSLNDHVQQVRAAAGDCLDRLVDAIPPEIVAPVAPYLVRRRQEWRYVEDRRGPEALLARSDVRAAIKETLMTSRAGWLPRFFRELLASDIADEWLVELASNAAHPAIRGRSLHVLTEGKVIGLVAHRGPWRRLSYNGERPVSQPFDVTALILAGARDRTATVRKIAAQGLIRHYKNLPDLPAMLAAFGDEQNNAIRERLDFIRRKLTAG